MEDRLGALSWRRHVCYVCSDGRAGREQSLLRASGFDAVQAPGIGVRD